MAKLSKIDASSLTKRALIDKANTNTVIAAGIAAFVVTFSLVASWSLFGQAKYQNRVISAKKDTLKTLEKNLEARDDLVSAYRAFESPSQNIIGGNPASEATDRDGSNAKIILDALPSKYDFPALTSSLEKFAALQSLEIQGITGTDDEVAQSSQQSSPTPQLVPIDFQLDTRGSYAQIQGLFDMFNKSIRPIQVQKVTINSNDGAVSASVTAQTFYQPEKKIELRKKVVQ